MNQEGLSFFIVVIASIHSVGLSNVQVEDNFRVAVGPTISAEAAHEEEAY